MNNIVDITDKIQKRKQKEQHRKLDAKASYVILENCLNMLDINDMSELAYIKKAIKNAMNNMVKIGNGR